jgi:hypothetical protein
MFESRGTHDHILLYQFRESPNLEDEVPVFISPRDRVAQLYLLSLSLSLTLRPTVRWPVSLGIKHPTVAYDQIFITVRQLHVYCCGSLSLTRGRVCRLQLLLALASAVILGSESRGTRDHIVLSQIRDFPFRRLLCIAGLRWRYSTTPPHGIDITQKSKVRSQNLIAIDGNSISKSWCRAPSGAHEQIFIIH